MMEEQTPLTKRINELARKAKAEGFWLSTAHAAKFCEVMEQAIEAVPELPAGLAKAMGQQKKFTPFSADASDLAEFLKKF